ncbi:hypothetical protein PUR49_06630 [Streptomyces sp. BE147]|uniref:hypothetical protein n=1 Tax=Streptomyces sp. BE147 TaxID=3002524 RepID=UPI002E7A6E7F|nr:hypothetical protein [Streptomyces sp. BE147]MEE1736184.1 hypothetical protein [Streptomyces sp. BE147]
MSRPCAPWSARPYATCTPNRPTAPVEPPADPTVAALRAVVDDPAACSHRLGELMLEVAPAHLSDTEADDVLVVLCDQIGDTLDNALAARRSPLAARRSPLSPDRRPPGTGRDGAVDHRLLVRARGGC